MKFVYFVVAFVASPIESLYTGQQFGRLRSEADIEPDLRGLGAGPGGHPRRLTSPPRYCSGPTPLRR
jgi:hypothetical protein